QSGGNLYFRNTRDRKLAEQVVLNHLADLPKPVWLQGGGWDDQPYIDKLVGHYGFASLLSKGDVPGEVTRTYVRGLLLAGKADPAAKLLSQDQEPEQIPPDEWGTAPKNLDQTVAAVQAKLPTHDLSDLYTSAAIACGNIRGALNRLEARLSASGVSRKAKLAILGQIIDLHCRTGDLKAVAADMDLVEKVKKLPRPRVNDPFANDEYDPSYLALKIGLASRDAGLIRRGIQYASEGNQTYVDGDLFRTYLDEGRFADLERLEILSARKNADNPNYQSAVAGELCEIYYRASRPKDILTLLRDFPSWPGDDVAKIDSSPIGYSEDRSENPPTSFYAAWAFAKTGQRDLALRTLRNGLMLQSHSFPPYELLNQVGGASALPIYEDLIRAHPLNANPILWKGDLLFRLGRLRDAEACLREAMALDPADGYAYRLKLNGLLAQILKKRGDEAGARRCADLVEAVGFAARARDLSESDVFPEAEALLSRAAAICPDDAAIQAQLAECLDKECRHAQADSHREKAIENLASAIGENSPGPDAFRSILYPWPWSGRSRDVLNACIKKHPKDACLYYARGVDYAWQESRRQAIADLERAVAIDPKFYLAWDELADISKFGGASPEKAQQYALKAIGIDPFDQSYSAPELGSVSDLAAAYRTLRSRMDGLPTVDDRSIFPLHTVAPERRTIDWPHFERLRQGDRFIGDLVSKSSDIRSIAALFHHTGFPFE
ncbi:MAG TPA: tetratricopeptide repeat protein, partial [Fimbriimonadaceae bacterium]|nr:tetratricopeptide repeat protein [Fimbriimonadaceae bacterium]